MNNTDAVPIGPDERALASDLASIPFAEGVDHKYWNLVEREGVVATFEIQSRNKRSVAVRLDCAGYPGVAPTGQLWSLATGLPLAEEFWPTGNRASEVFNPNWSRQFGGAFYFPYDRKAQPGHEGWSGVHPGYVWDPTKSIVDVLNLLREVLRSATGPSLTELRKEADAS